RRCTEDSRVRLAVVVIIGRDQNIRSDTPVQCREAVRRLVDVPVAFAAAEDRYVGPSVAVKVSSSIACRRSYAAGIFVGFERKRPAADDLAGVGSYIVIAIKSPRTVHR